MNELADHALSQTNFSHWDWFIVTAYLLVSLVVGLLVKRFATSMTAYIAAGRSVGTWLGVATMTGTELGLVTVMYSSQTGFQGGFAAFHIAVVAGLVTFWVGLTGFIVAPLRELGVLTIPEFYERRYNRQTRILGGIMLALAGILNMGLFLQVGSKFIVGVTGLSQHGLALPAVMTGLLVLVLCYTVMGGMISVIITDYIQFVVMSVGLVVTTLLAIRTLGWNTIFSVVQQQMGESGFNPFVTEGVFGPAYVLWMCLTAGLVSCAVWPTAVARALAMESSAAVKRQFMWSSISFVIRFLIPYFWGIAAFVFIIRDSGPLRELFFPIAADGDVEAMDTMFAMPIFLARILPAGILGIVTASMMAAFMSTHDSYLLCWSSVITQDIVAPLAGKPLRTSHRIALTRVLIILIGAFLLVWGLYYQGSDLVWNYMAITGAIYFTGAIPLLIGGLYWKRASSTGAVCSLLAGFTALVGLEPIRVVLGTFVLRAWDKEATAEAALSLLSTPRVGLAALTLAVAAFVAGSLLFPDRHPACATSPDELP